MNGTKVNSSVFEMEEVLVIQLVDVMVEDNLSYILDEINVQKDALRENGKIRLWTKDTTPHNLIITPTVEAMMKKISSDGIVKACNKAYYEVEISLMETGCILTRQGNETWLEQAK